MLKFLTGGNHGVVFQVYIACLLIFVWGSILFGLGFMALMLVFGFSAGVENSVV